MNRLTTVMLLLTVARPLVASGEIDFDRQVAPLLAARCLDCHNPVDHKGKLNLATAAGLAKGGSDGAVLTPGNLKDSPLWDKVNSGDMPPKKPIGEDEKAILKTWITEGGRWGRTDPIDPYAFSSDKRAGKDFWSLQPIRKPPLPVVKDRLWVRNEIDRFVLARLEGRGLKPNPPADPRTLIRRVYFDLVGLPPTPQEVDAFIGECRGGDDSEAYSRLVDRLLASPHYGERWARHWLDVVRYTESQGYEYDRFRPNAWHYRDYVIDSFNSDKPYDLFMREQIAGDAVNFAAPARGPDSEGTVATSLLVCGPWDEAGHSQSNVTQKAATREEEQEDLVSVVCQTFLGLTVNCARCHNHKFDPIPQADYYRIKSVFDGVLAGERPIGPRKDDADLAARMASLRQMIVEARKTVAAIELEARNSAARRTETSPPATAKSDVELAAPVARWDFEAGTRDRIGAMDGELVGGAVVAEGRLVVNGDGQFMRTAPLAADVTEKTLEAWVRLPTLQQGGGGVITLETTGGARFDSIVFGERRPQTWAAGSDNYLRTKDVGGAETAPPDEPVHMVVVYRADGSIAIHRNGRLYDKPYLQGSVQAFKAGESRILLGMRHTGGGNAFLKAEIEAAALYDRPLGEEEVARLFAAGRRARPGVSRDQMLAAMTDEQRHKHDAAAERISTAEEELAAIRPVVSAVSYCGTRAQPEPTHRLRRGDVRTPAEVVSPGALSQVMSLGGDFGLPPDAPESDRRVRMAGWLADPANPLPGRVMVNRLWLHHFGRGIVDSPNDFGFSGARPTHPELLDWLAAEFVAGQASPVGKPGAAWSVKRLHKLIVMSAAYRQASSFNPEAAAVDADDTLLWRFAPRRIEGEVVRDSMLAVSGNLNPRIGGPSFRPFTVSNHGSDFYDLIDRDTPEFNRRTIYRANVNSGKDPMMDALDCPDPAVKAPSRRVTTTPLAALALMNNSFVQRQADGLAARVLKESNRDTTESISLAFRYAFGRPPTAAEAKAAAELEAGHGMPQVCWVLLNATEFLYVK